LDGINTNFNLEMMTHVIVKAPVLLPKHIQVSESIVGGEIFKLDKQSGGYFRHSFHEFSHEFIHLGDNRYYLACHTMHSWGLPLAYLASCGECQGREDRQGTFACWCRGPSIWGKSTKV